MSANAHRPELSPKRQEIVALSLELIGHRSVKYVHGRPELGQSPQTGFDCSGFVRYVLQQSNLLIPPYITHSGDVRETRHTNELWDTYGATVDESKKLPGDLVFFSRNGAWPTHIGILASEDSYVHAPGEEATQVRLSPICNIRIDHPDTLGHRQVFETNPVGFKSPTYPSELNYRIHQRILE